MPLTLFAFFDGQIRYMKERGYEVHAVSSPAPLLQAVASRDDIPVHPVAMPRQITPLRDVVAAVRLWRILRRIRPQIVHSHTPKGGMLGMVAAWAARVPVRVYTIHGFPFATATGRRRTMLRLTERLSCRLADQVLCVSQSLRESAVAERVCPSAKLKVLLGGSTNGVDADGRFDPARHTGGERRATREALGIPEDAVVLGFVGRIVRDKGLVELAAAWQTLKAEFPRLHLLVVGPFEPRDPVPADVADLLRTDERIHLSGQVDDPAPMYAAMDMLALPSYREGFPYAPLEAAAMALPVVATRVTGCTDAVYDGVTGTLVPPHDAEALAGAVRAYIVDCQQRQRHGQAGRQRVLREFRQEAIWEALDAEYSRLLRGKGVAAPFVRQFPAPSRREHGLAAHHETNDAARSRIVAERGSDHE